MRILFTICGRAGSKGIKDKNIRTFLEKPLPFYTLSAIDLFLKQKKEVKYDIVVNTDSLELQMLMENNTIRPVEIISRTVDLSGDQVGKIEVIHNCLDIMEERKGYKYDMVVDLDITSPLRKEKDIENLVTTHVSTGADVTTSVVPARRNPHFNQLKRTEYGYCKVCESRYTARQQAPEVYDMNASLYAYNTDYLKTGKQVLDGYVEVIEMYDTGILDLDHENDFEIMSVVAQYLFEKNADFKKIYDNI